MIRIQTGQIRNTASELKSQRTEIIALLERVQTLTVQIGRQSYTEDTLYRLNRLNTGLEEIRDALGQLSDGLTEACDTVRQTEKKVAEIYESECPPAVEFTVQNTKIYLNANVGSIAQIRWQ